MGAKTILIGIWLIGYGLGFFGYLAYPGFADFLSYWLPMIFANARVAGAFISGLAGSVITTVSIILWSYLSRRP